MPPNRSQGGGEAVISSDGRAWHLERTACSLCGDDRTAPVLRKSGAFVPAPFVVVRCRTCSFVYVNPRILEAEIPELYDAGYYRGEGFDPTVSYAASDRESRIYEDVAVTLESLSGGLSGIECLEIGCGTGALLKRLSDRGAAVTGIDASSEARRLARERGVTISDASLNDLIVAGRRFDLVVMMEVIEHLTDPVGMLRVVGQLIKSGGYLYVTTGNWSLVRLQRGTPYVMPEGHLCYFTPKTLASAFEKAGLEPVWVAENRTWVPWRFFSERPPPAVRRLLHLAAAGFTRFAPAFGPFPMARKPEIPAPS